MTTASEAATLALVDLSEATSAPSPGLLSIGRRAEEAGQSVTYHRVAPGAAAELPDAARVVIFAPPPLRAAADRLREALAPSRPAGVELFDPFAPPAAGDSGADEPAPAYHLTRGKVSALCEVDALPSGQPVHPLVQPSRPSGPREHWRERLEQAAAALAAHPEPALHLNDERIPLDMERLRGAAEVVRRALRDSKSLCRLHLRAWPADLCDGRVVDHLTLLPLASLDVMIGSFLPETARRVGLPAEGAAEALRQIGAAGLGHLSLLSVAVALPGESPEDCLESMRLAIDQAVAARVRRLRFSLWTGGTGPRDSADQDRLFWRSHEPWHPLAYRALFDFVALMQSAMPQLSLIGPGLLPGWEAPETEPGAP